MTHHTDTERAEFIQWCVNDGCTGDEMMAAHIWDNKYSEARAWKAARRAPVVPVPQGEPVGSVYTMEALVPGGREVQHVSLYMPLPAGTKLYAAPQPPEAAPVQMPEPAGWRDPTNLLPSQGCTYMRAIHEKWPHIYREAFYTEQQVRQLLADQAIRASTIGTCGERNDT